MLLGKEGSFCQIRVLYDQKHAQIWAPFEQIKFIFLSLSGKKSMLGKETFLPEHTFYPLKTGLRKVKCEEESNFLSHSFFYFPPHSCSVVKEF